MSIDANALQIRPFERSRIKDFRGNRGKNF